MKISGVKIIVIVAFTCACGGLVLLSSARAAVPGIINYQSKLETPAGAAVTTTVSVQFSIYNHATNGASTDAAAEAGPLLWKDTFSVLPDVNGYFAVQLGSSSTFPSYLDFNTTALYLGVKVGADSEASPRARLGAAPYALNADRVDGISASTTAVANTLLALDANLNFDINTGAYAGASFTMSSSTATSSIVGNFSVAGNAAFATATVSNLSVNAFSLSTGAASTTALMTLQNAAGDFQWFHTTANPENAITGSIGDLAVDSVNGYLYLKESGSATDSGWGRVLTENNVAGTSFYVLGGNTFGETAVLGTNDAQSLVFRTNSSTAVTIGADQSVAVSGTTTIGGSFTTSTNVIARLNALSVGPFLSGLFVYGNYAYTVGDAPGNLYILDVSSPAVTRKVGSILAGGTPAGVAVQGSYAYVTELDESKLKIFNVSAPSSPSLVSSVSVGSYPYNVAISGSYAYTANYSGNSVSVVNISNPNSPSVVKTVTVGTGPIGIAISGNYLYTANYDAGTVSVVDITTPASASLVGTVAVGAGADAIYVSGNYAYTGDFDAGTISVVDVSNPASPSKVASLAVGSGPYSVFKSDNYLYVANYTSGNIAVVDVANPLSPGMVSTATAGTSPYAVYVSGNYIYASNYHSDNLYIYFKTYNTNLPKLSVSDIDANILQVHSDLIARRDIYAHNALFVGMGGINTNGPLAVAGTTSSYFAGNVGIGTTTPDKKLTVVGGISNLLHDTTSVTQTGSTTVGINPLDIKVAGQYAYITNRNGGTFSIVDIANPSSPVEISSSTVGTTPYHLIVEGRYLYIVDLTTQKLSIFDVSNRSRPVAVSSTTLTYGPYNIAISGRYAYIVNYHSHNMTVVDISNPASPFEVTTIAVGGNPRGIQIAGRYLYVGNYGSSTVSVIDVVNPKSPVQIATTSVGVNPYDIYVSGHYLYTADYSDNTMSIVNIANPAAPVRLATSSVGTGPTGVFVSGRYAYVANQAGDTISIVDVAVSSAPRLLQTFSAGADSGPYQTYVVGNRMYVSLYDVNKMAIYDLTGMETAALLAHALEAGTLQVRNGIISKGDIEAGNSLFVGIGGIMSHGVLVVNSTGTSYVGGALGVGTSTVETNYLLQLPNDATKKAKANAWDTYASSRKWKTDIEGVPDALNKILAISGINFTWNKGDAMDGIRGTGITAEDLDTLGIYGVTTKDESGEYTSINTTPVIAVLVEAVKEQYHLFASTTAVLDISASTTAALLANHEERIAVLEESSSSTVAILAGLRSEVDSIATSLQGGEGTAAVATVSADSSILSLLSMSGETLIINDPVEFGASVRVKGQASVGVDTAGQAKILAGASEVLVSFSAAYETLPIVTASIVGADSMGIVYVLDDVTSSSFKLVLASVAIHDVLFNWHAFSSSPEAKVYVSDGTTYDVNIVVVESPAPEYTPIIEILTGTSTEDVTITTSTDNSAETTEAATGTPSIEEESVEEDGEDGEEEMSAEFEQPDSLQEEVSPAEEAESAPAPEVSATESSSPVIASEPLSPSIEESPAPETAGEQI